MGLAVFDDVNTKQMGCANREVNEEKEQWKGKEEAGIQVPHEYDKNRFDLFIIFVASQDSDEVCQ